MNQGAIYTIIPETEDFPHILRAIPQPPGQLYVLSDNWADLLSRPRVAIVGSRKVSPYGRAVTAQLAGDLARAGVVVVSGLAIGVDGVAHRAALEAGGLTLAVLAGGLDHIHPGSHQHLAQDILRQGGALVSEYPPGEPSHKAHFIERNRLVSGLCQAVLITEAAEKSGTLHTARFALEQGREVLAVPGNITSPQSAGTNNLLKTGATLVTGADDVLHALGMQTQPQRQMPRGSTAEEQQLIDLLIAGHADGAVLLEQSGLDIRLFNQTLTMLEITGKIRAVGGNQWALG